MNDYEPIPDCSDYEDAMQADWANQEQLNELEQLTYQAQADLSELFELSPETALNVVSVFLKDIPQRIAENPQMFVVH